MTLSDFLKISHDSGVTQSPTYHTLPFVFGEDILESAKRHARFINKAFPSFGYRKHLENVAKASGFADWYSFEKLASSLIALNNPIKRMSGLDTDSNIFTPFVHALPLLIKIPKDTKPTKQAINGLTLFGKSLMAELGIADDSIMDVLAKLQGSDSWHKLVTTDPANTRNPLYTFEVTDDGATGTFEWSPACDALVDDLDDKWQGYSDFNDRDKKSAKKYVQVLIGKRPDFLEGLLAFASMHDIDGDISKAHYYFSNALAAAENLIPADFKGEIPWGYVENRFYHRILYNYMILCGWEGDLDKAIKLAKRQFKFNPGDNLGLRIHIPILLAANKQYKQSITSLKKISSPGDFEDAHIKLAKAICLLLAGNQLKALENFFNSVFLLPALVPVLLEHRVPDMKGRIWHRGVIPDFETLFFHLAMISKTHPQIGILLRKIVSDPDVNDSFKKCDAIYAESEKIREFNDSKRRDLYDLWESTYKELSKKLATRAKINGYDWLGID